ncbi:uncharacterized protein LOC120990516 isoform X2 [Bufo bufo]|uniref:uncharacterized protein LOC120990516 isoform X2 n=1 Tax=Bufo bufo TaxID=8384 RepID=UPI001ABEA534|nr:uncharacterized protein LOC120990516 isoform X2 [Bufo bufo]
MKLRKEAERANRSHSVDSTRVINMGRALLILLIATVCDVGEMKTSTLSVSSGSSVTLPTSCTFDPSNMYELRINNKQIGSYYKRTLTPRLQFSMRLQFDEEKCSFILKNLTEGDSNVYTFITMPQENERIGNHEEQHFNVTVTGHTTPASPMNQSTYHKDDDYGFLAVCFLLDMPVARLLMVLTQLLLWLVKKCKKRFPEVRPSCLNRVFEFILGDPFQKATIYGFEIGEYFSLVSQLVATTLFIVWNIYGQGHGDRVVWPILSAISFLVEMVMKFFRCCCTCLPETLRCPSFVMLFRPILISGLIVVAFSLIYYDIPVIWKMWYFVAALISLSLRVVLIILFYWRLKSRNETNNNPKTDPNSLLRPQVPPPAQT